MQSRMDVENPYYNSVNSALLNVVDPTANRICEFGCASGEFAKAVRERATGPVHYVGVELIEDVLERARPVLDIALQRNLDHVVDWSSDQEMASALPLESFDHIIFGDVLEHLYDPRNVLSQAVQRLSPGGSILACIPNVSHWSVFVQLISGSWPQVDSGLFDKTHIRWFTLSDMVRLFEEEGLVVETAFSLIFDEKQGQDILEYLEPLAYHLGVSTERLYSQGLPLQYVLVGRKPTFTRD